MESRGYLDDDRGGNFNVLLCGHRQLQFEVCVFMIQNVSALLYSVYTKAYISNHGLICSMLLFFVPFLTLDDKTKCQGKAFI